MIREMQEKLGREIDQLSHELNILLPQAIAQAVALGDLRENSEYKAALERQQFVTSRLSHLRLRLSKLSDVREADIPRDRVGFGSRVTVEDLETRRREIYALTLGEFVEGSDEGDEMPISIASPLGQALLNRKVHDKVDIVLPVGKRRLQIVALDTVHDLAAS
jgi:transcription elongation factor GreA